MTADQGRSLTTTLVVHAIIAALLLMLSLSSKNPPYEEGLAGGGGGGSFVEFGTIDFADADVVPETQEEQITTETAEETETTPEEIITTETEETVAINSPKENPKDKPAEKPTETPKKKDTEVKPIPKTEPELPKVNQGALFKKKGECTPENIQSAQKTLDTAASKGVIHRNSAARQTSILMKSMAGSESKV